MESKTILMNHISVKLCDIKIHWSISRPTCNGCLLMLNFVILCFGYSENMFVKMGYVDVPNVDTLRQYFLKITLIPISSEKSTYWVAI